MTAPVVLLDVDGVVADFVGPTLAEVSKITGRRYTPDDVTGWDLRAALGLEASEWDRVTKRIRSLGFCLTQPTYPGACDAVRRLRERAEVYFVTTPWRGAVTWAYDRDRWLEQKFGEVIGRRVVHTGHKHLIRGDLLIDDKPENCERWAAANDWPSCALLFTRPWNRAHQVTDGSGVVRVDGWCDVFAKLAELEAIAS